ncbi:hypothetical protein [Pseudomonas aeruginosa]|uniref:hypothetical protein n=1 Tax=Pseudomonas aeruginosa TaxID=287 RepID=UPI000F7DA8EC|nr:hypothetical protein [Pseudomonas aeruginosa]RTB44113.1 hypothetical protein EJ655_08220 [Pseudomonas aeruginosa]
MALFIPSFFKIVFQYFFSVVWLIVLPTPSQSAENSSVTVKYLAQGKGQVLPALNYQLYVASSGRLVLSRHENGLAKEVEDALAIQYLPPYEGHWSIAEYVLSADGRKVNQPLTGTLRQSNVTGSMYLLSTHTEFHRADPQDQLSELTGEVTWTPLVVRLENDGALGVTITDSTKYTVDVSVGTEGYTLLTNYAVDPHGGMNTGALLVDSKNQDTLYWLDGGELQNGMRSGRIRRIRDAASATAGTAEIETVAEFPLNSAGLRQTPEKMILASDGNLYGVLSYHRGIAFAPDTLGNLNTPTGAIWKLDVATSHLSIVRTFTLSEGELTTIGDKRSSNRYISGGNGIPTVSGAIVEGPDGFLYGGLVANCQSYGRFANKIMGAMAMPACGSYAPYLSSRYNAKGDLSGDPALLDNFDTPYPHYDGVNMFGSLYRISKDGSAFSVLHRFSGEDGAIPYGAISVGGDGNIYGTTGYGGANKNLNARWTQGDVDTFGLENLWKRYLSTGGGTPTGDGTVWRLVLANIQDGVVSSGFEHLYSFKGGIKADLNGNDGMWPSGLLAGADGKLYGVTSAGGRPTTDDLDSGWLNAVGGVTFQVDPNASAPSAHISLTAFPATISLGGYSDIQWTATNASNCKASGGINGDGWAGEKPASGTLAVSPGVAGTYTYTLTCDNDLAEPVNGIKPTIGNVVRLYVDAKAKEYDGNAVEYDSSGGGALSGGLLTVLGMLLTALYRQRRHGVSH